MNVLLDGYELIALTLCIGENIISTTYVKHCKVVMVSGKPKRVGSNLSTKFLFLFCPQKPCSEVASNPLLPRFGYPIHHYNVNVGLDIACNCCFLFLGW